MLPISNARTSPNHGPRPEGCAIDILLLHYTGMPTSEEALQRLCDPATQVSTHYVIEEDGQIHQLVPEHRRAWHAGQGTWQGRPDINSHSIGIELVNPGHEWGYCPFPISQIESLIKLGHDIRARHNIPADRVLGHSDIAPERKQDPGELFPWERLAAVGLGVWPDTQRLKQEKSSTSVAVKDASLLLRRVGYDIADNAAKDILEKIVAAFQRHFHPTAVTGHICPETLSRLQALAEGCIRAY